MKTTFKVQTYKGQVAEIEQLQAKVISQRYEITDLKNQLGMQVEEIKGLIESLSVVSKQRDDLHTALKRRLDREEV